MRRTSLTFLLLLGSLTACDDPAPVVLGRLQLAVRDAGDHGEADAAHEREHESGSEPKEYEDREANDRE